MSDEIEVLLATYNGGRYLREQLESIFAQEGVRVQVTARDDGSTDGTAAVLQEFAERYAGRMRVVLDGERCGSAKANFRRLMGAAEAEYVCFADQDDVWLKGKLARTMEGMKILEARHGKGMPLLVFSDLRVVDEGLRVKAESFWKSMGIDPRAALRLERLVGRSVVTGCTMLVNRRMIEAARGMPEEATMHDRWIGLIAAAMGASSFVSEPLVLYRQHEANVVGAAVPDGSVAGVARRGADDRGRRAERVRSELQAEALLRVHGEELSERSREVLQAYLRSGRSASRAERVWLTLRHGFYRGRVLQNAASVWDLLRAPSR